MTEMEGRTNIWPCRLELLFMLFYVYVENFACENFGKI